VQGEFRIRSSRPVRCGKTTMMNHGRRHSCSPSAGAVTLEAAQVAGPGPDRGVIFQEYGRLFRGSPCATTSRSVTLGANRDRQAKAATRSAIATMGLMDLPILPTPIRRRCRGGMRQRLAIARAYAVNPEFLLMDEPFGALDAQTRSAMQDLLLEVLAAERKTVMLITHSVEEAIYLSSRIVVMTARPTRIREIVDVPFAIRATSRCTKIPSSASCARISATSSCRSMRRRRGSLFDPS
jgi:NitT/TauT family transport system ATP-binding protein